MPTVFYAYLAEHFDDESFISGKSCITGDGRTGSPAARFPPMPRWHFDCGGWTKSFHEADLTRRPFGADDTGARSHRPATGGSILCTDGEDGSAG